MMRQSLCFLVFSLATQSLSAAPADTPKPSSAIPERREFPVNEGINPCDDFYAYTCSKTIESFALRPDRSVHTFAFNDSHERLLLKKKAFLKEVAAEQKKGGKLSPRSQTLGTIYNACMDPAAGAREEKARVAELVKTLAGIKDHAAFAQFIFDQSKVGRSSIVDFTTTSNLDKPDIYDFSPTVNMMSLPERSYYENPDVRKDFKSILVLFYKTIGLKNAEASAEAVLNLETGFAKVNPLPAEWREIEVRRSEISRADLVKKYPNFRMDLYLPQVPETTLIRHLTPDTYAWVDERLAHEKLETLKALVLFQLLSDILDDGYPKFRDAYYAFGAKHLGNSKVRKDREERCTASAMTLFSKELDAELLPKVFPNFPEEKFVALAEEIRKSIINGIDSNQWLSPQGKAGAKAKMEKARLQLVKPRNDIEWRFQPELAYDSAQPLTNQEKLNVAIRERDLQELKEKRNSDVWHMSPLTINAYYSPEDNKFVLPIGILQYPFYDPELPIEINLGSVGAVIGHELGHGIDDQGALFDAEGRLKQWMTEDDVKNFKTRGEKFITQFDGIGQNGKLTLGENIGDLTGVTFAYRAAFPEGKGTEEMKRKFFLQYARVWCGVMLPKAREKLLKTDPHSLGQNRVNQQMKNQPEFAKAFQCKNTDAMVLPEKDVVKIW